MNYRDYIRQINGALKNYKASVDLLATSKVNFEEKQKNTAEAMKSKYSAEYIAEHISIKQDDFNKGIKSHLEEERTNTQKFVNYNLDKLQSAITKYFCAPVSTDFVNTLNGYKIQGVELSKVEIELLQSTVHTYPEMKMLNAFIKNQCQANTDLAQALETDSALMDLPTADKINDAFKTYKTSVNFMVNNYCGSDGSLHDLLEIENPNFIAINADAFFTNDNEKNFADLMDSANGIIPQAKTSLTDTEIGMLGALFDKLLPYQLREAVPKICKYQPELIEIVNLSQYAEYLPKEMQEQ